MVSFLQCRPNIEYLIADWARHMHQRAGKEIELEYLENVLGAENFELEPILNNKINHIDKIR